MRRGSVWWELSQTKEWLKDGCLGEQRLGKSYMKVVVVGAGPAGLISALNLIQEGISPLILEKGSVIRSTACGEACDLQALNMVPFDSNPYICKKVKGAKLIFHGGIFDYLDKESGVLDRANWLNGMAREVEIRGGQVKLNSKVVAIDRDSVRLETGEDIGYDILIGADGPNSQVAKYLGIKHQFITACQYKVALDASKMDYLEFYFDKRFSFVYSWIFPKDGLVNIGLGGDFAHLDAFLRYKGLDKYQIMEREAGIVPVSGIQKLVHHNIALIGDSASMTSPISGGGLAPIIYASQILVRNLNNLENYEREVKKHPMADPVLLKGGRALVELTDRDLTNVGKFLVEVHQGRIRFLSVAKIVKYPSLFLKLNRLTNLYKAVKIAEDYGW